MSADRWFERCEEILAKIRTTQSDHIRAASAIIADSAQAGGGLHIYDTGHCSGEPLHRAGGLVMIRPFRFSLNVESSAPPKRSSQVAEQQQKTRSALDEQLASLAVQQSALSTGDVLIIVSVSGKAATTVQLAADARRLGAKVVAITNVTYSKAVESQHSSGNRLYEVADVVIDNCGVVGDAVLDMEGVGTGVAPTSGIAFCYIIWAIVADAVAQMRARGLHPQIYRSVNLPDGDQFNARAEAAYREAGV